MAMSDRRILSAMRNKRIIIEPFNQKQLGTSSYDVRLGRYFYREQSPDFSNNLFNMYDPEQVKRVWGACQEPERAVRIFDFHRNPPVTIKPDDEVIVLDPGETILAHTEEFIGGQKDITTMMKARSSLGRSFILVCKCAGWGDVGYVNRWTFEITNVSQHYRVPLLVGSRVAQIVFLETGDILGDDYSKTGNYQTTDDIEELKRTWAPDTMLPKVRP